MNPKESKAGSKRAETSGEALQVLVHTVSSLEEQTTPSWLNISDTNFQALKLFRDSQLLERE